MTRINRLSFLWKFGLVTALGGACGNNSVDTGASTAGPTDTSGTGAGTSSTGASTSSAGAGTSSTSTSSTGEMDSSGVPTSGLPDTSTGTSTGDVTEGSTGTSGPCSRVHQGDLVVKSDTDLAPLADIGRVTGSVYIVMADREQPDLTFLGCLHTIDDALSLQNNMLLESMAGLESLNSVFRIRIFNNAALRLIDGIGPIEDLFSLVIDGNSSLEEIHLDSVKTVGLLQIGHCQGMMASAKHNKLIDLSGFSGLTSVQTLIIEGNAALMTADVLDTLATNGGPKPLLSATVRYNLLLPEASVHVKLDVLGLDMQHREVCGNAEGDPVCFCVVG